MNNRAKAFLPLEAILSKASESWVVGGVASNFFKDLDGDAISPAAIQQAIPGFMANRGPDGIQGGPLRLHHGFWERFLKQAINGLSLPYDEQIRLITAIALPLGRVTEMSVDADGTTRWRGVLSQANPIARVIWDMLREGMIHLGVSVGGKIHAVRPGRDALGRPCNVITSVRLDELSITDNPANRLIESESPDNGAYIMALAKSLTLEKAVRKPSPGQLGLFEMPAAPSGGLRPKKSRSQGPKDGDTKPAKGKAGGMLVFGKGKWRRQDNANKPGGLRPKASQPARSARALAVLNDDAPAMGSPKQKSRPRADRNWQSPKPPAAMGGRGMAETSLRPKPKPKPSLPEPMTLGTEPLFEEELPKGQGHKIKNDVGQERVAPVKPGLMAEKEMVTSLAFPLQQIYSDLPVTASEQELDQLANDLKTNHQYATPTVIQTADDEYQLVDGANILEAAKRAGLTRLAVRNIKAIPKQGVPGFSQDAFDLQMKHLTHSNAVFDIPSADQPKPVGQGHKIKNDVGQERMAPVKPGLMAEKEMVTSLATPLQQIYSDLPVTASEQELAQLANDLKTNHQYATPTVIETADGEYQLVNGANILEAAKRAGLTRLAARNIKAIPKQGIPGFSGEMFDRQMQHLTSPKPSAAMGGRGMAEPKRNRPVGEPPKHYLVDVAHIKPSKPASAFDPQEIESLAQSILESGGLLKPVVLQENGPMDYSVLSGDLEYHAAARAKQINPRAAEMVSAFVVPPSHKEEAMDQLALRDQLSGASDHHQDARVRDPRYYLVDVADIKPSKPASAFDQREIESLAQSILATGQLLSPLVVQENGPMDYSVLSGDLEYYAAARAKQLDPRAAEMVSAFVAKPNPEQTPVSTPAKGGPSERASRKKTPKPYMEDQDPSTLAAEIDKIEEFLASVDAGLVKVSPRKRKQTETYLNQIKSALLETTKVSADIDEMSDDDLLRELGVDTPEATPEPTLGEMLEQQQAEAEQPMPEPEPAPAGGEAEGEGEGEGGLRPKITEDERIAMTADRIKQYYDKKAAYNEKMRPLEDLDRQFHRDEMIRNSPEWTTFDGGDVLQVPGSNYVAVPVNGRKNSSRFDIMSIEPREYVTQVRKNEVHQWLTARARRDESDSPSAEARQASEEWIRKRQETIAAINRGDKPPKSTPSGGGPKAKSPKAESTPKPKSTAATTTGNAAMDERLSYYEALSPVRKEGLTSRDKKSYERLKKAKQADPKKWNVGDNVSYRLPEGGQINRGFRIVSVDPDTKTVRLKMTRDTGLTETGGNEWISGTTEVHIVDLQRDNSGRKRNLKKTGTIMGNLNSFLAKALGGSPGRELTSGSWQDTTTGMGRGLGAPTSQQPQGSKQIQMDNSSSAHAGKGIGGKQPKAQRPYSSGGMPPTDVWGMTMTQLTRELAKCSRMDKEAWGSPETVGFLTDSAHAIAGITDSPHAELVNFVRFLQNLGQFAQALPHMDDYQAAGTVVAMNNDLTKALDEFVERLPSDLKGQPMRPPGSPGVVGLDIQFPTQYIVYS